MTILIIILSLVALIFILAALSPTNWTIKAEIIINKSQSDVFNYIKILRNAEHYSKWVMTDPQLKKEFKGEDGTVGFAYSWESAMKQVGQGEQEILNIVASERIDYEIRFIKPFEGVSKSSLILESVAESQTKVTWTFSSSNNYMMKVFHVLMNLKKALAKDLHISLINLKTVLEKQ
jgi:uncharacterized protein YndB with AHSA1/START domain